jgi:hypothetical protein
MQGDTRSWSAVGASGRGRTSNCTDEARDRPGRDRSHDNQSARRRLYSIRRLYSPPGAFGATGFPKLDTEAKRQRALGDRGQVIWPIDLA